MTRNTLHLFIMCIISGLLSVTAFTPSALAKPDAETFGQLPNIFDGAISPDGKRYAYIGVFNGQYNLLVRRFEDPNDIQVVGFTKGAKPKDVRWANDRGFGTVRNYKAFRSQRPIFSPLIQKKKKGKFS